MCELDLVDAIGAGLVQTPSPFCGGLRRKDVVESN